MITLDDFLRDMTYGELSFIEMGNFLPDEHESEPDPKAYARLTSHINLGLKAIYSEFFLASEEIYIEQKEEVAIYVLSFAYAASNTASLIDIADRYIADTAENPFKDNVLKIESVYDELGNPLFLNNSAEDLSLFTTDFRSIQMPFPNEFNTVAVQYRAGPAKLIYTPGMDPTLIEVVVPHPLHEALQFYVASRVFSGLNSDQGVEGNDYYQKYLARVGQVRNQGLYIQAEPHSEKFEDSGWV